ncbi:MAG: glycosyltransferase family 39 protein [Planctomycetaceae bacterium]|nr:glycosyltransferase family 39 protein [Planctomycetaceae bacterium]
MQRSLLLLFCAFAVIYCSLFFSQVLPNNPGIRRADIWGVLLDQVLLTDNSGTAAETVQNDASSLTSQNASFASRLLQRQKVIGSSLLLLFFAWGCGRAIERALLQGRSGLLWSERLVIQFGTGLSLLSLATLFAGLAGKLSPAMILLPAGLIAIVAAVYGRKSAGNQRQADDGLPPVVPLSFWLRVVLTSGAVIYGSYLLTGAMSPPTDFDVREYHLQGPKEWFLDGRIHYLRHNVYTSFPFHTEMLSLAGMVISGDWWTGAISGKLILGTFSLLTSLCVYSIARRHAGLVPAILSTLIHLTTPWTMRIALIAYAEGALTFYLALTVMLCLIKEDGIDAVGARYRWLFLIGLMAGSAMACKYTGLVNVILPCVLLLCWRVVRIAVEGPPDVQRLRLSRIVRQLMVLGTGILVTVGPWLARNFADTANPVFPLAYSVFGGPEWSTDVDVRWKAAHGPSERDVWQIPRHAMDAAVRNDWTSPLLFAFLLPSLVMCRHSKTLTTIWLLVLWQFGIWWGFTHRIDRFWIPVIPLLSVTAGWAWHASETRIWRRSCITIIAVCTVFNLRLCTLPLVGFHAGLMDFEAARQIPIRSDFRFLNERLPKDSHVLMVGEAQVFDANFQVTYNTVFDDNIFEEWTRSDAPSFGEHGVTHVMVNWFEVLRYRVPGSYGYCEYVQPSRFEKLVEDGWLSEPMVLMSRPVDSFSTQELELMRSWAGYDSINISGQINGIMLYEVIR